MALGQDGAVSRLEFPFQFREGLLWVEVSVPETNRPLNFLLDSGAEASVINLQTARELDLSLGQRVGVRGVGVSTEAYWCGTKSARTAGLELPSRFLALDLGKLSSSCERHVDGLIGADFFRGRAVQIDFHDRKVRLLYPDAANVAGEVVPLEVRRCGMRAKASINGKKPCWFRVDTGCASALQWVTGRVSPNNCTSKVAVGLAEMGIPQTRTTVKIGAEVLSDVETGLHARPIFEGEAGLVGNSLLSQFEAVTIDSINGRLVLGPRLASAPTAGRGEADSNRPKENPFSKR